MIFVEDIPITEPAGVYGDIIFHKTATNISLLVTGDTTNNFLPTRDVLYTYSTDNGLSWTTLENLSQNGARTGFVTVQ